MFELRGGVGAALGDKFGINMLTFFVDKRKAEKSQRSYPLWITSLVQHQL
ncbi:TPA: hypothetical protein ACG3KH_004203 [Clostridioides difficile]